MRLFPGRLCRISEQTGSRGFSTKLHSCHLKPCKIYLTWHDHSQRCFSIESAAFVVVIPRVMVRHSIFGGLVASLNWIRCAKSNLAGTFFALLLFLALSADFSILERFLLLPKTSLIKKTRPLNSGEKGSCSKCSCLTRSQARCFDFPMEFPLKNGL